MRAPFYFVITVPVLDHLFRDARAWYEFLFLCYCRVVDRLAARRLFLPRRHDEACELDSEVLSFLFLWGDGTFCKLLSVLLSGESHLCDGIKQQRCPRCLTTLNSELNGNVRCSVLTGVCSCVGYGKNRPTLLITGHGVFRQSFGPHVLAGRCRSPSGRATMRYRSTSAVMARALFPDR